VYHRLNSFCEAMIKIRQEIADIEGGRLPRDNNPLVNAPHPAGVVLAEQWDRCVWVLK
jgi:glycine dehydrogenase